MADKQPDITRSFTNFLRKAAQLTCQIEDCQERFADTDERVKAHLLDRHAEYLDKTGTSLTQAISACRKKNQNAQPAVEKLSVLSTLIFFLSQN